MVSFSSSADSSHVATQVEPKSDVQSVPVDVSSITSQLKRMEIAAQKGIASPELRAGHHHTSSRSSEKASRDREHKRSDPPPTPQMTPYISRGVRAPARVRREDSSDSDDEAVGSLQTVFQIHPKGKERPLEPYQILQNGSRRFADDTIRYSDGRIQWQEMLRDGRIMWVERLPDGSTRWLV